MVVFKKIKIVLLLLLVAFGFSQTLSSNLSKDKLALGEKAVLRISISQLKGKSVIAQPKNKLLPFHFEELKDETTKSASLYTRTVEFQVFEEGTFQIPALEFSVNGEILKTVPYEVMVFNPVNAEDKPNDIMNNKQVDLGFVDYWEVYKFYILTAIAIFVCLFLFLQFFKHGMFRRKSNEELMLHKTLIALKNLEQKQYPEKGNFRMFYVELIDITRAFITQHYRIAADVLLTDDLIEILKRSHNIPIENEKIIEEVFLRGDLVKFAKIFPDKSLMKEDFQKIYEWIEHSTHSIETEHLRADR